MDWSSALCKSAISTQLQVMTTWPSRSVNISEGLGEGAQADCLREERSSEECFSQVCPSGGTVTRLMCSTYMVSVYSTPHGEGMYATEVELHV